MQRLYVVLAVLVAAFSIVACGDGGGGGYTASTSSTPTSAPPSATTVTQSIALPTAPPSGSTVAVNLPAPGGIAPALDLGAGYTAGTSIVVSAANYGQTSAIFREPKSTFASCPVLLALNAYVTLPLPVSSLSALTVSFGSVLAFLGTGTYSAEFYDAGVTLSSGTPPAPAAVNGCAIAPATSSVLATATGSLAGGVVAFSNFVNNPNVSGALLSKYNLSNNGNGAIPASTVFGFYVTFVAAATSAPSATPSSGATSAPTAGATPTPTAGPTATPTAGATSTPTAGPTATPTAHPTATPTPAPPTPTASPSTTLAEMMLLGSAGFVNTNGRTVYVLSDDTTGSLACLTTNGCTGVWPIVTPPNGGTLSAGFTTFVRSDNSQTQLAYNGHPLYEYAGDASAGQTNGNNLVSFGGTWTIARP